MWQPGEQPESATVHTQNAMVLLRKRLTPEDPHHKQILRRAKGRSTRAQVANLQLNQLA